PPDAGSEFVTTNADGTINIKYGLGSVAGETDVVGEVFNFPSPANAPLGTVFDPGTGPTPYFEGFQQSYGTIALKREI
ncbi:MAG: hypothetical protein V3S29_13680, partial [bacterium]